MDGLPGMQRGLIAAKRERVAPIKKMVGPLAPSRYQNGVGFSSSQVMSIALLSFMIGIMLAFYGPMLLSSHADLNLDMVKGFIQPLSR